jgi:hypothetical protein
MKELLINAEDVNVHSNLEGECSFVLICMG